ncbi:hypothetical protein [Arthrobacter sp. MYb222]|uniref:hypothetical protein n=1 Tax=Arthrobacter sp. MYb222 TaxID=1848599 RepID=UPI0011B05692|nr:hypothetical protein [Arthrobacter sp. MYb222]
MTRPGPNMAKCPENLGSFPSLGRNMPETLGGYQKPAGKTGFRDPRPQKTAFSAPVAAEVFNIPETQARACEKQNLRNV